MTKIYNVYDFGAVGDGIADDTAAVQAAIDAAAAEGAEVHFLPGVYSVGELFLHKASVLTANPNWGYAPNAVGTTVLKQRFDAQRSLLNVSNALYLTINGLALLGKPDVGSCCGIYGKKVKPGSTGDLCIERTKVSSFSQDALFLDNVGCISIRGCQFGFSGRDGIHAFNSPDYYLIDTWMSGNRGCGFAGYDENCSVTMTGCRVEWNAIGVAIYGGSHYQLTGNYIDRSYREGILLTSGFCKGYETYCNTITMTGNIIYRSGKEDPNCAHLKMDHCIGVTAANNTFCIGRDDHGNGYNSPNIGVQITDCKQCVVSQNTLFMGAMQTLVKQENNEDCYIENNPGSLFDDKLSNNRVLLPSTAFAIAMLNPDAQIDCDADSQTDHAQVQKW